MNTEPLAEIGQIQSNKSGGVYIRQVVQISLLIMLVFLTACSSGSQVSEKPTAISVNENNITLQEESDMTNKMSGNNNDLCTDNEETVFSFETIKTSKLLSVCTSRQGDYIIYRFGQKYAIELEYPNEKETSWNAFSFSSYLRGGGANNEGLDLNYLIFTNGSYEYKIYDEYSAMDDSYDVGVVVTELNTKNETIIKGDVTTKQGTLIKLRGSKIPQEDW